MNIISGNCAGTFSGFLAQLAWMETSEKSNGEINLLLHTRNKTHYPGSCICADRPRFPIDIDWKGGRYSQEIMSDEEYFLEYQNAFLDVILSSKSDFVIGSSNMFLASLIMNPSIPFNLFCVADGC